MAAQAALIAETIAGMKQALARYHDCKHSLRMHCDKRETDSLLTTASDSDEPYLQPSNRGNKLKRKVHSIQDGHAGSSKGLKVYKRVRIPFSLKTVVEHADAHMAEH